MQNKPTIPPQSDQKPTIYFQNYIYTKKIYPKLFKMLKIIQLIYPPI